MIRTDDETWYSSRDLLAWLACRHQTYLDSAALDDRPLRRALEDAAHPVHTSQTRDELVPGLDAPAQRRGNLHERAMLALLRAEGRAITEIAQPSSWSSADIRERASETFAAMQDGADVVYQATLLAPPWFGFADFLVRVPGVASNLGDYAYEIRDTKLARHPSVEALLQMALYGQLVQDIQGVPPVRLAIWLGDGELFPWRFSDAEPYLMQIQERYLEDRLSQAPTKPEPVAACETCRWLTLCDDAWGPQDLKRVHRLTRRQRGQLREQGIMTVTDLAVAPDASKPSRMATRAFQRLREQAATQIGGAAYTIVEPQPHDRGLAAVPAPHELDMYLDLEGDPFAAVPTLDYLWAYCDSDETYTSLWAHAPDAEHEALSALLQELESRQALGGDWHVYHYNAYERTSLRRVAAGHPDTSEARRRLALVERLIDERFVDLYPVVESSLRTQDGSTSLKVLEKLAGYDRSAEGEKSEVSRGDSSIVEYERYLFSGNWDERSEILANLEKYNRHDVRATRALHLWLRQLAQDNSDLEVDAAPEPYQQKPETLARIEQSALLRDSLLDAADISDPLPSGLSAEGARILANMLEWHRKEMLVAWADKRRLEEWALNDGEVDHDHAEVDRVFAALNGSHDDTSRIAPGTELESVLMDLEFKSALGRKSATGNSASLWEYSCRPGSWKFKGAKRVREVLREGSLNKPRTFGIEWIDPQEGIVHLSSKIDPGSLGPLMLSDFAPDEEIWRSIVRLADSTLSAYPAREHSLAMAILDLQAPLPPETMLRAADETASQQVVRLARELSSGLLPVQGPPGTGKTTVGAAVVAALITDQTDADGPLTIGVTSQSHKVIDNFLLSAAKECDSQGLSVLFVHVGRKDKVVDHPAIHRIDSGKEFSDWLASPARGTGAVVVGGTAYAWALPELAESCRLLIIDEAGQFTLANSLAVAQAAPIAIALGDPQQLAAVIQASHEEGADASLLEHISQGLDVLPPNVGVFLDESYRMHDAVCRVVSKLSYSESLVASASADARSISGPDLLVAGRTIPIRPGVIWIPADDAAREVEITADLLSQMVGRVLVDPGNGSAETLTWDEVRVVAPHNAHVNRISTALPPEARVGTVDLFQGQQGHVVVYSMGRLPSSSRDVTFLYELNRLNVALSRARLMAFVISHPDAVFPPVSSPDHLMLASRFIEVVSDPGD